MNKKILVPTTESKTLSVTKTVLAILWQIGKITVKAFFPHPYSHIFCKHGDYNNFHVSISKLKRAGLIYKNKNSLAFELTEKGEEKALFAYIDAQNLYYRYKKPKNPKWDGYWRLIIFDIPEEEKKLRERFRQCIKSVGFRELQKSVWIYPYKIPDFVKGIFKKEKIKSYARFITIKKINYDADIKRMFRLT